MPQDANHLIWIDMEMTGLRPEVDRIIEVALVVTDSNLATVAEAPVLVVHQDERDARRHGFLEPGDARALRPHRQGEGVDARRSRWCSRACSTSCASTCRRKSRRCAATRSARTGGFSRAGCRRWKTIFTTAISTSRHLKELCKRWQPDIAKGWVKQGKHEALADIYESIDELKYYRGTFIRS